MSAVIGTGIDAVEIGRFRALLVRRPRLVQRLFSLEEQSLAKRRNDPVPTLAARFAAKEAAMKALSTGLGGVDFTDLEVLSEPSGAPRLVVSGRARERAGLLGVTSWHVSLTHTEILAMAVVVVA
ncbi:MAG: holo-ACP synthase [Actinomycetota bacterium]|jgi:holo-[acyl-carrier protein] synthase|nr:holo-ACP synthase [Actinomycetota bacterium]